MMNGLVSVIVWAHLVHGLPAGARPSPAAQAPPQFLPRLAKPLSDRGPMIDPTREASSLAAVKAALPSRAKPAPFDLPSLPDPFENGSTVQLRVLPQEDATPTTRFLPMPRRR